MKKKRKNYRPDEKVGIIRRHLIDGAQVSDLCEEHELRPTVYYRWQKQFFVNLSQANNFQRGGSRVVGEDVKHIIFFIPTGIPNMKEALDRAIESVPGAVALADGVIERHSWVIPLIYGRTWYSVEGTPIINPNLVSTKQKGNDTANRLDNQENIEKANFEQLNTKLFTDRK